MTEPADRHQPADRHGRRHGRRRRRSSGKSSTSSWASRRRRSLVAVAVIAVLVLAAAGLSITLGGGGAPAGSPSQPSVDSASGFPLVSPAQTPVISFPPVATDSPTPAPSPSQTAGPEIKAKRIQIQRLEIDLKIVEGDGIDAPIGKAAHYPGTGWPGGGTNIYIYGHARTGMFLSLWDVKVGDEVVLTLVDDTQRTYVIAKVIPKVPWDAVKYLAPTPTEQLTLQTSTSYHATSPRFIAIAYPAP